MKSHAIITIYETCRLSSHFGFKSTILLKTKKIKKVVLVGEARTHCVVNSLKQMLEIAPQLAPKIIVLEDCMSNVPNLPTDFYTHIDKIYADAKAKGVQFQKSTDF